MEIFFERFCVPEGQYESSHAAQETVTEAGIIGGRQEGRTGNDLYYNHMPALEIRENLGKDIFDSYFKFCVIRNPFDAQVSKFWWRQRKKAQEHDPETLSFSHIKKAFREFINAEKSRLARDREIYMLDNIPVMDKFIQFENLHRDLADVCSVLKIEYQPGMLGNSKAGLKSARSTSPNTTIRKPGKS